MTNPSLTHIRLQPEDRATISGLSQGIGRAFNISPGLVRFVWLLLYTISTGVPDAISAGVPADGLVGWIYLFWLMTGGSPVIGLYLLAWAFTPHPDGRRSTKPLLLWLLLLIGPLALMTGITLAGMG
jgi:phage shock protein PspC (stress-responsive transcriptional regulator)